MFGLCVCHILNVQPMRKQQAFANRSKVDFATGLIRDTTMDAVGFNLFCKPSSLIQPEPVFFNMPAPVGHKINV